MVAAYERKTVKRFLIDLAMAKDSGIGEERSVAEGEMT